MDIKDLFKIHNSAKRLNESMEKVFGKKINFETFTLEQLHDARNKLRTQVHQARVEKGFNENLENDAFHQAQWMLDAINAEIAERDEHIVEAEADDDLVMRVEDFLAGWMEAANDHEEYEVHGELVDLADNFDKHRDIHKLRDEIKGLAPLGEFYKSLLMFLNKEFKKDLAKSEGFDGDVEEGAMKDLYTDVEDFLVGWQDAAVDHEEYGVQGELVDLQKQFASSGDIDELYNELKQRAAKDEFYKSLAIFFKKEFKHALGRSNEDVAEGQTDVDYELHQIAASDDEEELIDAMEGKKGNDVAEALKDMMEELKDELAAKGMNDVMRDQDKMIEMLMDKLFDEYGEDGEEYDYGGETDDEYALASAGFGNDEDYESIQNEGQYKDVDDKTGAKINDWLSYHIDGVFDDNPHLGDDLIRVQDKWDAGDMSFRQLQDAVLGLFKQGEWQRADFIQNFAPNKVKITQPDMFDGVTNEVSPPGFKGTVKAMKKHKDIDNPYALAWHMKKKGYKSHKKADGSDKNESVQRGDKMTRRLREGEVQQASAIVTAKTMVDRVGRWIEELSGMENETLLQLGDSIRDEMGQEQSRAFIEQVAPAIQSALETLKGTRETISAGVNTLATGEAPSNMLGAEPAEGGEADMAEPAPEAGAGMGAEEPAGDEFAAAEPAAGGLESPGREQRESIQRKNNLLKILAG